MLKRKKNYFRQVLSITLVLLTVISMLIVMPVSTSAATNRAGEYTISGSYNTGESNKSGYLSDFRITVGSQYFYDDSGGISQTKYQYHTFDWTYFVFYIYANDIASHTSFRLTRNGSNYTNLSLSGSSSGYLYKGSLPDGDYVLVYVGEYWDTIFSKKTYTFTYNFTVDTTAPSVSLTAGGLNISSGSYTNQAIKFSASDTYSEEKIYYKAPGESAYSRVTATSKSVSATSANNGWWYFYAGDGYQSTGTYSVYLDTVYPVGYITNSSGASLSSGSYTNKPVIYTASDKGGVNYCEVFLPNASSWSSYAAGTALSSYQGWYYFRAVDKAGNVSGYSSVYYDATAPYGTLYGGDYSKSSGSYTNASYIKYVASDSHSGVSSCYVLKPGSSSYVSYTSGTQFTSEGTYYFYCVDRSGNQSSVSYITIDRTRPTAQLYVDGDPIASGSYTNGEYISFESNGTCYVKLPNSTSFTQYISGTEYDKVGKYVFYAVDSAGNQTGEYTLVIDRTQKSVELGNVTDGNTDGDVIVTWADGEPDIYAPISEVSINGVMVDKDAVIYTINAGKYEVVVTDAAGNVWSTSFTSTKKNILTDTLVNQYYEVKDVAGNASSFSNYENAINYAKTVESGYVNTGVWSGGSWDGGIAMDAKDSVNAKNGTYYVYKKSGDSDERVAYFTVERLNDVIREHAKQRVQSYYYWQKTPADFADGEMMYIEDIISDKVTLGDNITAYLNGELVTGTVIDTEGKNTLTICDAYGNSCDYTITVVRSAPNIVYSTGGGNNTADTSRTYYFKDGVTVSMRDIYDGMAMLYVLNSKGKIIGYADTVQAFNISDSGSYTVVAINHSEETRTFKLILSRNAPTVTMSENVEHKRLDIVISESEDLHSNIQSLEIYKSTDSGESWTLIFEDDYGNEISLKRDKYSFRTSGIYKVVLTDEFRTGIDAVTVQYAYGQKAPTGTLTGVENGGYTSGAVMFKWTDEATVTVKRNGEIIEYRSGRDIREDGEYIITIENFDGFKSTYFFTIDTKAPKFTLNGVENGGTVNTDVSLTHTDKAQLYKNGELVGEYISDTPITEDGVYRIVITDLSGNETETTFTIDKTAPTLTLNGVLNGGTTKGRVTLSLPDEEVSVKVYLNGEDIGYKGQKLKDAGAYTVVLTDSVGNVSEYSFEILETIPAAAIVLIVVAVLGVVGTVVAIIISNKRKKEYYE